MYNPFSLEGKTILVTGASSGIGRATAIECSRMGAEVILTGRSVERLNETLSQLTVGGGKITPCDLTNEEQLNHLIESISQIHGVVINAGINKLMPVRMLSRQVLTDLLETNTISSVLLLQKLVKSKKLQNGSSVVFTSSMSALGETAIGNAAYSATKGAISAFAKVAALELAPKHIRVNCVCPGEVQTPLEAETASKSENRDAGLAKYPLGRYGKPEDVAMAMVYLLSDASSWVTGTDMVVDGGMAIG